MKVAFVLAALLTALVLAACGGDAAPREDATIVSQPTPSQAGLNGEAEDTTAAPATEETDRERTPAPGSVATDREALVTLYNATDGPNWKDSENWLSDAPLGEWAGVGTYDSGRVNSLLLGGHGLRGEIPPELENLDNLHTLDLSNNQLSGEIPPELANINPGVFDLSNNQLSGEITLSFYALWNTRELDLSNNQLSGAISIDVANFTGYQLESLNLSGNQLSGEIPPELGNYEVLEFLDLSGNQLGGEIPSHLGDLASLTSLDLSDNQLSGEVPSELADRAASMEKLNLRGNESNGSKLEFGSDVGEYLAAVCGSPPDAVPVTWGELEAFFRGWIELMEQRQAPKALQDYARATIAVMKLMADFSKEKDPDGMIDWDEWSAFEDGPEYQAVMDAADEAEDAFDPEVQAIIDNVCN